MIVLDSSGLFAALSRQEPSHRACRKALTEDPGPFVLSPFVLAEVDYFVSQSGGQSQAALLEEVAAGRYLLAPFDAEDIGRAAAIIQRYADLRIGLADASIIVLAERHRTSRILTLDERHFRVLLAADAKPFTLLPADA